MLPIPDPVTSPPTTTIAALTDALHHGWGVFAVLLTLLLMRAATALPVVGPWLAQGRRATAVAGLGAVLTALWSPLSAGLGWGAALLAAGGAVLAYLHPAPASASASTPGVTVTRAPEAGRTRGSVMLALAIAGVGGALLLGGCGAGLRERAAAGAGAGVSCELGPVAAHAADLVPLADAAVHRLISGAGEVDTAALDALLADLKDAAPRCAVATVIAALAVPSAAKPGVATQALSTPQPAAAQLVLALGAARQRWGGPWTGPIETARGTVP